MAVSAAANELARLPRYKRVDRYRQLTIGRPKKAILEAVARYRYLDANQLAYLLFSPRSLTYVMDHCKELFHAGYLVRVYLPRTRPTGSSRAIYALDAKGYRYLAQAAAEARITWPTRRFRPSEDAEREMPFLKHILESNSLLISAARLAKQRAEIQVADVRMEKEMRRDPMKVEIVAHRKEHSDAGQKVEKVAVIPDAWVDLRCGGTQQCIAFEVDHRGTQSIGVIQRKIYGYLAAFDGPYQEKFGTKSITVAFVVRGSPWSRVERLRLWTEAALTLKGKGSYADFFRFSNFDTLTTDPTEVFFSPMWFQPFTMSGVPLLEVG